MSRGSFTAESETYIVGRTAVASIGGGNAAVA
jgi:hypothetical protein